VASATALGFTYPQDKSAWLILFTARNAICGNFCDLAGPSAAREQSKTTDGGEGAALVYS
jgi:hypothetical protein